MTTPRRSREEQRVATRRHLLDAATQCLLERGYGATTVAEVQERAGVARGTLLHHFPTKAAMMVAAMAHLAEDRLARLRREVELIPATQDRLQAMVDFAWRDLNSSAFFACLELWVAARTDTELRDALVPLEVELFRNMHTSMLTVAGADYQADPRTATLVEFTIDALTGLSMTTILTSNLGHRELLIRRWKRLLAVVLGQLDAAAFIEGSHSAGRP